MSIINMLGHSRILAIPGSGVVFTLLLVFAICIMLVRKALKKTSHDKDPVRTVSAPAQVAQGVAPGVIAAIAAAVGEYRKSETEE